ncbi:DUF2510 domain-containing protein [Blastococcus tunisiensis]|uniref:DUF2510 domain-containing protein n=1 Tax=Blastococcus tunisiensis TaxID=1798228 RepID=UPI0011139878|nr:DUF2510 domain-containing protein [Blastococcus sp. DSM 46838]
MTVAGSLGFDRLLAPGGQYGNVEPLILGCAAALAVLALLLFVTRVPGLGVLWRVLALAALVLLGLTAVTAWSVVNDPASVVADPDTLAGQGFETGVALLEALGFAVVEPGVGLWLLTAGSAIAGIGVLVPATRSRTVAALPHAVSMPPPPGAGGLPPGWYPDQFDPRCVRFFDGRHWTGATRISG